MKLFRRLAALGIILALLGSALPMYAATADLNGDGSTDEWDAVYLLYHTLLPADYPLAGDADYDRSGTADEQDVLRLLYHVLLPEEYPLWGITLPTAGYDPDDKGRIQLAACSTDGETVSFTFKNLSKTWVTEEISTIAYVCAAADGTTLASGDLLLGYVKCGATVTRTLTLPEGTAAVTFTGCSIPYWSTWK